MVTALNEVKDRVRGLEVGADDFLTKLVNDVASFARIRSLVRLKRANEGDYDLVLVSDGNWSQDALRLCSQLRSGPETQRRPILIMVPDSEDDRLAKALELGVNNYLVRPIERDELISRSRT
jgi:two-component system cell cycle response regulator